MIFFNDKELARRFKADTIPARERLIYFLIYQIVITILLTSYVVVELYHYTYINHWDITLDAVSLLFVIIGTLIVFRTNSKGDNLEFIERFICISFPISVQLLLIAIIIVLISVGIELGFGIPLISTSTTIMDVILFGFIGIYYYTRLNQAMKIASH